MNDFLEFLQFEWDIIRRRLRGMAMIARGIVPNLVISQRMVDHVTEAARHFLADETGESMVGLVLDAPEDEPESMPTLIVLDTIAPDESVIRRSHMFEQGDELQAEIFNWLTDNWEAYQTIGKDMTGKPIKEAWRVDLKHLGDWHKQPGYMIQPSGGDLMTALRILDDEEQDFEFLLVPIVTLGHDSVTSEIGASVNYFTVPMEDGTSLRMDWWYIHRDVRIFQPITPMIIAAKELPTLTPHPWHMLDVERMDEELALLEEDGKMMLDQTMLLYETDGDLPLEICFMLARSGSSDVLIVVTNWDYPRSEPQVRLAPFTGISRGMDMYAVFDLLWSTAKPVKPAPEFKWTPDSMLVDYIASVEETLGIRKEAAPRNSGSRRRVQTRGTVTIPVEVDDSSPKKSSKKVAKPAGKPVPKKPVRRDSQAAAEDD
jgi:hypothetical protein